MSVGLTVLLALVAWALGPLILRCAGGLMATAALLLWAIPMGTHTSFTALIVTGLSGAAIWRTGTTWQARRHAARLMSRSAPPGRELIGCSDGLVRRCRNTRGTRQRTREPCPINQQDPGNTPHRETWDEGIIDGIAHDVEPPPPRW
jgi:hypothetical protein